MNTRNPAIDPIPGDIVHFGANDRRVILVDDGDVIYRLPGGMVSFVTLENWRKNREMTVVKRGDG